MYCSFKKIHFNDVCLYFIRFVYTNLSLLGTGCRKNSFWFDYYMVDLWE